MYTDTQRGGTCIRIEGVHVRKLASASVRDTHTEDPAGHEESRIEPRVRGKRKRSMPCKLRAGARQRARGTCVRIYIYCPAYTLPRGQRKKPSRIERDRDPVQLPGAALSPLGCANFSRKKNITRAKFSLFFSSFNFPESSRNFHLNFQRTSTKKRFYYSDNLSLLPRVVGNLLVFIISKKKKLMSVFLEIVWLRVENESKGWRMVRTIVETVDADGIRRVRPKWHATEGSSS